MDKNVGQFVPQPGDVLFIKSAGKLAKINLLYQKVRSKSYQEEFTHVGLVISSGLVLHSIPSKGELMKMVSRELSLPEYVLKSGVTIDSLSSSGFIDKGVERFLVLRNKKVTGNVNLQNEISSKALYYFGLPYNFLIDFKVKLRKRRDARLSFHCSELIARVFSDVKLRKSRSITGVLPVDIYDELKKDKSWQDVTIKHSTININEINEINAKFYLKLQLTSFYHSQSNFKTADKVATGVMKLNCLLEEMKEFSGLLPDGFVRSFIEVESQTLEEFLNGLYRLFHFELTSIYKTYLIDEYTENRFDYLISFNNKIAKELFLSLVNNSNCWFAELITMMSLIQDNKYDEVLLFRKFISQRLEIITNRLNVEIRACDCDLTNSYAFIKDLEEGSGNNLLALAFTCLASSIISMNRIHDFFVKNEPIKLLEFDEVIKKLNDSYYYFRESTFLEVADNDYSVINIDFGKLLGE